MSPFVPAYSPKYTSMDGNGAELSATPLQSELAFRRLIDSPGDGRGYLLVSPAGPPTGLPRMALCPCLCRRPGGCCHRREDGPPEGD